MSEAHGGEVVYPTIDDFHRAAAEALGLDLTTVRSFTNETLAGSALAAPRAGFGDFEQYPDFATKMAVLLQAVASNHALPDGNKRTALLCSILFAALNGLQWIPPQADDPDGTETAEVVEAASTRSIPLGALAAWMGKRLVAVPPALPDSLSERPEGFKNAKRRRFCGCVQQGWRVPGQGDGLPGASGRGRDRERSSW